MMPKSRFWGMGECLLSGLLTNIKRAEIPEEEVLIFLNNLLNCLLYSPFKFHNLFFGWE
jgi:hypothetical protein